MVVLNSAFLNEFPFSEGWLVYPVAHLLKFWRIRLNRCKNVLKILSVTEELTLLSFVSTSKSEVESTSIKRLNVKDMGKARMKNLVPHQGEKIKTLFGCITQRILCNIGWEEESALLTTSLVPTFLTKAKYHKSGIQNEWSNWKERRQ